MLDENYVLYTAGMQIYYAYIYTCIHTSVCTRACIHVNSRYLYIVPRGWWWHGRNSTSLQIPGILECETTHLSIFGGVVDVALNLGSLQKAWVLTKHGTEPSKNWAFWSYDFFPEVSPKVANSKGNAMTNQWFWGIFNLHSFLGCGWCWSRIDVNPEGETILSSKGWLSVFGGNQIRFIMLG